MKNVLTSSLFAASLLCACVTSAQQASKMPEGTNINSDAKLMADFRAKVDDYLKLRKNAEGKSAPVTGTDNPKQLIDREKALAAQVRAARAGAKRGDLFTPATEAQFRRLMNPALKGSDGPENKVAIKDDAPEKKDVPFTINGDYPRSEALSTVPPDILRALPPLPPEIQYRFVARHLILYDSKANIIIDYMLNALPPLPTVEKK
jgi:hypothetical protein